MGAALSSPRPSEKFGLPADRIIYLGEDPAADPRIQDRSTQENVERSFHHSSSPTPSPDDHIFVVLIGHGSYTAVRQSRFNLPGRDLTARGLSDCASISSQIGEWRS